MQQRITSWEISSRQFSRSRALLKTRFTDWSSLSRLAFLTRNCWTFFWLLNSSLKSTACCLSPRILIWKETASHGGQGWSGKRDRGAQLQTSSMAHATRWWKWSQVRFKTPPSNCCAVIVTDKTVERRRRGRCHYSPTQKWRGSFFLPTTSLSLRFFFLRRAPFCSQPI